VDILYPHTTIISLMLMVLDSLMDSDIIQVTLDLQLTFRYTPFLKMATG